MASWEAALILAATAALLNVTLVCILGMPDQPQFIMMQPVVIV